MKTVERLACLCLITTSLAISSCNGGGLGGADTPTFKFVKEKEGGCADIYLYKGTADNLEVLWISADKKKLNLPEKGSKTFDLADKPDGLTIGVDLWEKAPRSRAYCNDIDPETKKTATWKAKKGKVTITITPSEGSGEGGPKQYKASARLEGIVFEDAQGNQVVLKEETISEVRVGWYAG